MTPNNNVANAVGAITARACDSCIRKRARWYCAADDAFLCHSCDSLIHSANPLARRHKRFRSNSASIKCLSLPLPPWHRGFTKKARTPRRGKAGERTRNCVPSLVPEVGSDEISLNQEVNNEIEHSVYQVPIFDQFVADFCTSAMTIADDAGSTSLTAIGKQNEQNNVVDADGLEPKSCFVPSVFGGSLDGCSPSDTEFAAFAADVESLFGKGNDNELFGMEELGLIDYCHGKVKVEENNEAETGLTSYDDRVKVNDNEIERGLLFQFDFGYECPATHREEYDEQVPLARCEKNGIGEMKIEKKKRNILLRLDYEAVITAWASQDSPWTTSNQPDFDPDCLGSLGSALHHTYGPKADGEREARVSRYREKRRTRLFSKKIRYEVRKLNAEKRPRMKGRFVKRASFTGPGAFPLLNK